MDAAHCIPEFEFTHLGVTTQSGRFDKANGTVTLDRATRKGSVYYEVDTRSLNMGFGTETPNSPGYVLFEVTKFPTISFRSEDLYFDNDGNVIAADGRLSMLGVEKSIHVWVSRFKCSVSPINRKDMCSANVKATLNRSEFGMLRFIPAISDEIRVSVPIEAYKD